MRVPQIILKTTSYVTLSVVIGGAPGLVRADQESANSLRTEVKAALATSSSDADKAAEAVGKAIAEEIVAAGLKIEILKPRLEVDSRSSKVVALKTDAESASGQADQT